MRRKTLHLIVQYTIIQHVKQKRHVPLKKEQMLLDKMESELNLKRCEIIGAVNQISELKKELELVTHQWIWATVNETKEKYANCSEKEREQVDAVEEIKTGS